MNRHVVEFELVINHDQRLCCRSFEAGETRGVSTPICVGWALMVALVLDTPFETMDRLLRDIAAMIQEENQLALPSVVVSTALRFVRASLHHRTGLRVPQLKPVLGAHHCTMATLGIFLPYHVPHLLPYHAPHLLCCPSSSSARAVQLRSVWCSCDHFTLFAPSSHTRFLLFHASIPPHSLPPLPRLHPSTLASSSSTSPSLHTRFLLFLTSISHQSWELDTTIWFLGLT